MSLILNDTFFNNQCPHEGIGEDQEALEQLNCYLTVIEDNKKSSTFVPNDALIALDMAGFARGLIGDLQTNQHISAARMALALVQPSSRAPTQ